jgi:hypothetical protein
MHNTDKKEREKIMKSFTLMVGTKEMFVKMAKKRVQYQSSKFRKN